ncbi:arylsulfatase A [Catalinimonas alkaloidigena]|uniref:sulfatase-like hydrolase/transferase n=1 Tax=Catalinimonas alkaloidigena TaxID=1075417 RepID=UPI0024049418|nr:sulfatase-like hydrolase/transferase [Catalinimonas alkaloidigena]MDF9796377.1 arylsulfatase A [Catalinimonas alkaloidigena]
MKSYFYLLSILFLFSQCGESQRETDNQSVQQPGTSQLSPNIIILLADDLGYGDLSSYGNPVIHTPHLDAMASEGIRFTSYEAAPWCVPSRVELLTGRYMARVNLNGGTGADGTGGLPDEELTLAEGLKAAGYNTGMAGKWHLGYKEKKFLPTNHGFDSWLGLPYSNDYIKPYVQTDEPLVMYRDTTVAEYPVNQDSLTVKYTAEAIRFINEQHTEAKPFFFYLAYNMPHLPIHTTREFFGQSKAGLYGDVIQTIDWSVGQIRKTLEEKGLSENTIIFFASDNGPWQNAPDRMFEIPTTPEGSNWEKRGAGNKPWHVGTVGPLRGYKHTTYEGGTRVPAIICWPGTIQPAQVSDQLVANLDMYRTFLSLGGGTPPEHKVDGHDITPYLLGETDESPRKEFAYFINNLQAMRVGSWKLREMNGTTELFNVEVDSGEKYNRADEMPEMVSEIRSKMQQLAEEVGKAL